MTGTSKKSPLPKTLPRSDRSIVFPKIPPSLTLAGAALLTANATVHAAESLITDGFFESYPAESPIATQRGWTAGGIDANTLLIVSAAESYESDQSLLIADRSSSQRPRAIYNLSHALVSGTISLAIKEDQSDDGESDAWNITFGTFALVKDAANFALAYSGGGAGTAPFPRSTAILQTGYNKTGWNTITLSFSKDTGHLAISINGTSVAALSFANSNYQWGGAQFSVGTFSSSGNADVIYVDALSVAGIGATP